MTVYDAINKMRELTKNGESFSFSFMSYSIEKRRSEGIIHVPHARLAKQSRKSQNQYADYMINFIDLDLMKDRHCWQPLIIEFNDQPLTLSVSNK